MVSEPSIDPVESPVEFRIQPNAALRNPSWRWFLAVLAIVSLLIAGRFAWLGYWMILPFTLLELGVLAFVMWLIFARNNYVEKIMVGASELRIEHLQQNRDRSWSFPVYWTQVQLERPSHRWYPHRLLIGCKGEWVEVGSCLTDGERSALADAVRDQVSTMKNRTNA
ncbi:MAG: DUF2244 domain-containing protein [Pseudomonadota bacterium]